MKDIAPNITRQRLLIEAKYSIEVNEDSIKKYFDGLTKSLNLQTYGKPIIHMTGGDGKDINQGYDAFVPLIDSGISLYVWVNEKFLSCVIYTCKKFSVGDAINFTKEFFKTAELDCKEF